MLRKLVGLLLAAITLVGCGCVSDDAGLGQSDDKAPGLVSEELKNNTETALIRVEFVLSLDDKEKYPEAFDAFMEAAGEWAKVLPIEIMMFVPTEGSSVANIVIARPGIVILDFVENINAPEDTNWLGTFSWATRMLRIDMGDMYSPHFNSTKAKSVSMHELGHMFGLTHIYNSGDLNADPGSIIVSEGAESLLMAPALSIKNFGAEISDIEAEFALKYVQSVLPTKLDRF